MKIPPEVKKIADKYCDENGGPPRKKEERLDPGTREDYAATLRGREHLLSFSKEEKRELFRRLYFVQSPFNPTLNEKLQVAPQKTQPPQKPWAKFNPTLRSPRRT